MRAWRGWPVRWRPCGRASNRSTTASRGCPSASRRPPRARSRPGRSSKPCRAGSGNSIRARSASTSTTSARWPRCGWPTNGSPSCSPPSAAPNARWRRCGPASMRCRWARAQGRRRVAHARTTVAQGFSGRSPSWSRCVRGTRRRWPRCSDRRPTRWPPTSFGAARSAVAALKQADGGPRGAGAGRLAGPRAIRAPAAGLPDGALWALDLVEAPPRLRGAMTAMLSGVAVVDDLGAGAGSGGGPPAAACGHASTATWWAPAG